MLPLYEYDRNYINIYSTLNLVKLQRFSVFFIRSCLQDWFVHFLSVILTVLHASTKNCPLILLLFYRRHLWMFQIKDKTSYRDSFVAFDENLYPLPRAEIHQAILEDISFIQPSILVTVGEQDCSWWISPKILICTKIYRQSLVKHQTENIIPPCKTTVKTYTIKAREPSIDVTQVSDFVRGILSQH